MPKFLLQVVSFLLLPCLFTDPVLASFILTDMARSSAQDPTPNRSLYGQEALAAVLTHFGHPGTPNSRATAEEVQRETVQATSPSDPKDPSVNTPEQLEFSSANFPRESLRTLPKRKELLQKNNWNWFSPSEGSSFGDIANFFQKTFSDSHLPRELWGQLDFVLSELLISATVLQTPVDFVIETYQSAGSKRTILRILVEGNRMSPAEWQRLKVSVKNYEKWDPTALQERDSRRVQEAQGAVSGVKGFALLAEVVPSLVRYTKLAGTGIRRELVVELPAALPPVPSRPPSPLKSLPAPAATFHPPDGVAPPAVLLVLGPSGAGKSTLARRLVKEHPDKFVRLLQVTTRSLRPQEDDEFARQYISRDRFDQGVTSGEILAVRDRHGHRYGIDHDELILAAKSHRVVVMESHSTGEELQQVWPGVRLHHIMIAPLEVHSQVTEELAAPLRRLVEERIKNRDRGIQPDELAWRSESALKEIQYDLLAADLLIENPQTDHGLPSNEVFRRFEHEALKMWASAIGSTGVAVPRPAEPGGLVHRAAQGVIEGWRALTGVHAGEILRLGERVDFRKIVGDAGTLLIGDEPSEPSVKSFVAAHLPVLHAMGFRFMALERLPSDLQKDLTAWDPAGQATIRRYLELSSPTNSKLPDAYMGLFEDAKAQGFTLIAMDDPNRVNFSEEKLHEFWRDRVREAVAGDPQAKVIELAGAKHFWGDSPKTKSMSTLLGEGNYSAIEFTGFQDDFTLQKSVERAKHFDQPVERKTALVLESQRLGLESTLFMVPVKEKSTSDESYWLIHLPRASGRPAGVDPENRQDGRRDGLIRLTIAVLTIGAPLVGGLLLYTLTFSDWSAEIHSVIRYALLFGVFRPLGRSIGDTDPFWREIRPGRFLVNDRIAVLIKMVDRHGAEFGYATRAIPEDDPDYNHRLAQVVEDVTTRLFQTVRPTPFAIRRPFSEFETFLVESIAEKFFGAHPEYERDHWWFLLTPGHIMIPHSVVASETPEEVAALWTYEEARRLWVEGRKKNPREFKRLEALFQRVLSFAKLVKLDTLQRRAVQNLDFNPDTLRDFLTMPLAAQYPRLDDQEFWIRAAEKPRTEMGQDAFTGPVTATRICNVFMSVLLQQAEIRDPLLYQDLLAAQAVVAVLYEKAAIDGHKDIEAMSGRRLPKVEVAIPRPALFATALWHVFGPEIKAKRGSKDDSIEPLMKKSVSRSPPDSFLHSLLNYAPNGEEGRTAPPKQNATTLLLDPLSPSIPVTEVFQTIRQAVFSNYFEAKGISAEVGPLPVNDVRFDGVQDQLAYLFLILLAPFRQQLVSDHLDFSREEPLLLTPLLTVDSARHEFIFSVTAERTMVTTALLDEEEHAIGVDYPLAERIARELGGGVETLDDASGKAIGFSLRLPLAPAPESQKLQKIRKFINLFWDADLPLTPNQEKVLQFVRDHRPTTASQIGKRFAFTAHGTENLLYGILIQYEKMMKGLPFPQSPTANDRSRRAA